MRREIVFRLAGLDRLPQSALQVPTWPVASAVFTAFPTGSVCRIDAQPFRLLLCRRLRLPSPLSSRTCRCGRLFDVLGHHRAACGGWGASETERRVGVRRCTGKQGSRRTRLDERDGLRFRCDLIQCEGRTPSGSLGGRVVPLWRRIICDRHGSGLSPGKGWHSQKRCVAR